LLDIPDFECYDLVDIANDTLLFSKGTDYPDNFMDLSSSSGGYPDNFMELTSSSEENNGSSNSSNNNNDSNMNNESNNESDTNNSTNRSQNDPPAQGSQSSTLPQTEFERQPYHDVRPLPKSSSDSATLGKEIRK